jgi:hypothetical protein
MPLNLRQVAFVAEKLEPVLDDLRGVFDLKICYVDPEVAEFGLENSLLPIGTNFIEVVAPTRPGTAAGRYLERRNGDSGYMVITQADGRDDQVAHRNRATELGVRIVWQREHDRGQFLQLHPADTGGAFFEIDSVLDNDPLGTWPPAGEPGWEKFVNQNLVRSIRTVELQSNDPLALAERWGAIAALEVSYDPTGQCILALENATIRFVEESDGRGEGLSAVDVEVVDKPRVLLNAERRGCLIDNEQIVICGVRFNLH